LSSAKKTGASRRTYFGDVLTGGALIAATTTVAPEPAKADVAKVRRHRDVLLLFRNCVC
jgi:hypothetical protein